DQSARLRIITCCRPVCRDRFRPCQTLYLPRFRVIRLSDTRYHRVNAVAPSNARPDYACYLVPNFARSAPNAVAYYEIIVAKSADYVTDDMPIITVKLTYR